MTLGMVGFKEILALLSPSLKWFGHFHFLKISQRCEFVFTFYSLGTKGVSRDMKKVCSGARRDEGKTWFSELSDKGTDTSCNNSLRN